ncbi:tetratricopeptide repeat-containing sensor histidine kinase [Spirosoma utsteinense]|uniref:histidine kinase n=1 Tax=Spirosoma utsteinense TaxID=2585773 RepID=A0ABR6W8B8_9BACT|nr:tetratricopeptide repeat protein [Spirosoma utsteinense]MBC3787915.1 signal transduction histidine kinase [Spirosoma utsteinense]MBC3792162.1 signal transduction histidine kinase [Spirosoma utsteinense]
MPRLFLLLLLSSIVVGPAFGQPKTGQVRLDSLLAELHRAKPDTNRVNLLYAISKEYYYSNSSEGINYASQALALARRLTWKKGILKAYNGLGNQYFFKPDYPQALTAYLNGLKIAEETKDKYRISTLTANVGLIYQFLTNYSQAVAYYKKALKGFEELGKKEMVASVLGSIGTAYGDQGEYAKALDYQLKSVKLLEAIGFKSLDESLFNELGLAYLNMADYPKALTYLQNGLNLSKTNGNKAISTRVYSNLGKLYLKIATDSNTTFLKTLVSSDKATTLQKANAYIDSAVMLAKEQGAVHYLYRAYQTRSQIQDAQGDPQAALASYQDFIKTKDLIINQQNTSNIAAATLQYEFDKKETALRYEQQLSAVQLQQQKQQRTYLLGGVGLLLTLLGLIVYGYAQKQKANTILQQQKEEINHKSNQLEQSLAELRVTQTQLIQKEKMASLGELTAGIAHEIQNPLNFVTNFSEVSAELVTELEDELQKPARDPELEVELLSDLKQNLQKITHHGGRASAIVRGMLEHSRTTTGEKRLTDLNALADEYLKIAYHGLRAKDKDGSTGRFNAELKTDFQADLAKAEAVPQELGRVLLNLYNNAFYAVAQRQKTAPAGYQPTVTVSTKSVNGHTQIRVSDNGTGIPAVVQTKIFQPFFTTKPTGEGTGLGLSLSYDIVTKGHGGSLMVKSQEGQGTEFLIQLPNAAVTALA